MILILFGPPGAGKGTQSNLICDHLGFTHVSTGDLLRAAITDKSELGKEAQDFMNRGMLVPDEIVVRMVEEKLKLMDGSSIVFDGFPRTVPQALSLESIFEKLDLHLGGAVFLEVPNHLIIRRLAGRRQTPDGKYVYHIEFNPPKKVGICDVTGVELIQRTDDHEDVISARLEAYSKSTAPLKEFYKSRNCLKEVSGEGSAEEVFYEVSQAISFFKNLGKKNRHA